MLQNGPQMLLILLITYYITRLLHGKNVPPILLQLLCCSILFRKNVTRQFKSPCRTDLQRCRRIYTESWVDRHSLEKYFPAILKDWTNNDFIQDWARERALLNLKQSTNTFKRHPYEPCYLYEAGILPLQQYPVKG